MGDNIYKYGDPVKIKTSNEIGTYVTSAIMDKELIHFVQCKGWSIEPVFDTDLELLGV